MNKHITELEKRLWSVADELRANSDLKASEYSMPVLGLIFLKYADYRFAKQEKIIKNKSTGRRRVSKTDYQADGVMYLPDEARFSHLLNLPEGADIGKAINEAMKAIERENEDLKGVLPKTYNRFNNNLLVELLKVMSSIPEDIEGDAFGKIYEYFLGNFAMSEGQQGGEFFTPISVVKLIVSVIQPFHGKIFDPACGSGGMFVQSAEFVEEHKKRAIDEISVYGQEKTRETVNLCKMNLAVHGLSGDILQGNSYYEDLHDMVGNFDFVMANPPFNVNRIDKERIKNDKRRFPFGMPNVDNGNYLWIQLFYSALNKNGRAGFVMHNSAADAELEIRKKLVTENVVDIIITLSANLFYTVSLPCTLWFLDKSRKSSKRQDSILFIEARELYQEIDGVHREITEEQISKLAQIVNAYRGGLGSQLYKDIPGICKKVSISDVIKKEYILNPKIYVSRNIANNGANQGLEKLPERIKVNYKEAVKINKQLCDDMQADVPFDRGLLFQLSKMLYMKTLTEYFPDTLGSKNAKFKNLPTGWSCLPFRKIVTHYQGGGWGKDIREGSDEACVQIIRGTDIAKVTYGEMRECPKKYVSERKLANRLLKDGDIIIEVSGGGKDQPTGRTCYITDFMAMEAMSPLICASFCKSITIDSEVIYPVIGFLHLQKIYDQRLIEKYEVQSTGIKNFKFEYFLDNELILIPPKKIQDKLNTCTTNIFKLMHVLGAIYEDMLDLNYVSPLTANQLFRK